MRCTKMANAVYMFLMDCDYDHETDKAQLVNVHVCDLGGRGFTKLVKANDFLNSIKTNELYNEILKHCEDFDFVTTICALSKTRFNMFELFDYATLDELYKLDDELQIRLL